MAYRSQIVKPLNFSVLVIIACGMMFLGHMSAPQLFAEARTSKSGQLFDLPLIHSSYWL